jgi:hypothetical protein
MSNQPPCSHGIRLSRDALAGLEIDVQVGERGLTFNFRFHPRSDQLGKATADSDVATNVSEWLFLHSLTLVATAEERAIFYSERFSFAGACNFARRLDLNSV